MVQRRQMPADHISQVGFAAQYDHLGVWISDVRQLDTRCRNTKVRQVSISEVALHRARLVPGWVTISEDSDEPRVMVTVCVCVFTL